MSPEKRELLGKMVRNIWVGYAEELAKQTGVPIKQHHTMAWEELDERIKEGDRRIGEQLYAVGFHHIWGTLGEPGLGQELLALRNLAIADGMKLLNEQQFEAEVDAIKGR
jgi:predicted urease superfamily metal-dependent hydrolase